MPLLTLVHLRYSVPIWSQRLAGKLGFKVKSQVLKNNFEESLYPIFIVFSPHTEHCLGALGAKRIGHSLFHRNRECSLRAQPRLVPTVSVQRWSETG